MFLYETHLHTYPASACAIVSPEQQVRYYKNAGYTGIIVTDHFINGNSGCPRNLGWAKKMMFFCEGYERAKREGAKCDLDVFFGVEFSFEGTDFLLYGLSPEFLLENENFDKLRLNELSATVRGAGGYIAQAHPFRTAYWIADPRPASPELLDGLEVHNGSMSRDVNKKARNYAEKHGLPMQAGSDSHDTDMRNPSGIALKKRANSIFDIIEAIKSGQVELLT